MPIEEGRLWNGRRRFQLAVAGLDHEGDKGGSNTFSDVLVFIGFLLFREGGSVQRLGVVFDIAGGEGMADRNVKEVGLGGELNQKIGAFMRIGIYAFRFLDRTYSVAFVRPMSNK